MAHSRSASASHSRERVGRGSATSAAGRPEFSRRLGRPAGANFHQVGDRPGSRGPPPRSGSVFLSAVSSVTGLPISCASRYTTAHHDQEPLRQHPPPYLRRAPFGCSPATSCQCAGGFCFPNKRSPARQRHRRTQKCLPYQPAQRRCRLRSTHPSVLCRFA
jgi:hypothetical protein